MGITISDEHAEADRIFAELEKLDRMVVDVGIHGDDPVSEDGLTNAFIGFLHESGIPVEGEPKVVPQRAWLSGTIDARRADIEDLTDRAVDSVAMGDRGAQEAGDLVAQVVEGWIRDRIRNRGTPGEAFAPLAEATIDRRAERSDVPLLDTGQLNRAILGKAQIG